MRERNVWEQDNGIAGFLQVRCGNSSRGKTRPNPNDKWQIAAFIRHSSFVIRHFIRATRASFLAPFVPATRPTPRILTNGLPRTWARLPSSIGTCIRNPELSLQEKETPALTETVAHVLGTLGSEKVYVVHGSDGSDEVTVAGDTRVTVLEDGRVTTFSFAPESVGIERANARALTGGTPDENAADDRRHFGRRARGEARRGGPERGLRDQRWPGGRLDRGRRRTRRRVHRRRPRARRARALARRYQRARDRVRRYP